MEMQLVFALEMLTHFAFICKFMSGSLISPAHARVCMRVCVCVCVCVEFLFELMVAF